MLKIKLLHDLTVTGPDHIFIIGNNGSGKSTFLKAFFSKSKFYNIDCHKHKIAYLPQNFNHFDELFVEEFFLFMQSDLSHEILVKFDIEKLLDRKINEISGGEKQRVYLASVMSQSADIFLLDEPLNNLDLFWQNKFLEIADQLSKTKLFFTISHDLNVVQCFAKNILVFDEMKFQMYKKNELMNSELLERIFKVKFIKVENKFMITYV